MVRAHVFHAVAFMENFQLRELAEAFPDARRTQHEVRRTLGSAGGEVFMYPFGAVVFHDVDAATREKEIVALRRIRPGLKEAKVVSEEFTVREDVGAKPAVSEGTLVLDKSTPERASIIALTVGQSAAMEYYERIVEDMFIQTDRIVERLEHVGTVSTKMRPLHRFIGAAIGTRNEVLSVLHLLDKPDAAWEDPGMSQIYDELRAEFDLVDRYRALELKLGSVQDSLELVLDVARDRRLVLLEITVVLLILLEVVLGIVRAA